MPRALWNDKVIAESEQVETVEGNVNKDAAWTYPDPKPEAGHIKDHIAFWRGVKIEE